MAKIVKSALAALLISAVFLAGVVVASDQDLPQPKIFIQKMRHDYGKTYEQEKYEYNFVVQNKGKADLVIDNVKPG